MYGNGLAAVWPAITAPRPWLSAVSDTAPWPGKFHPHRNHFPVRAPRRIVQTVLLSWRIGCIFTREPPATAKGGLEMLLREQVKATLTDIATAVIVPWVQKLMPSRRA